MTENLMPSYLDQLEKCDLNTHAEILRKYKEGFQNAINLELDIPIFLDTNVLLKTYSISFSSRKPLLKFFKERQKQIHISNQVQKEFLKNREEIINRFFDDVTRKLPNDFKDKVVNQVKSFLEYNKTVLVDYSAFEKKLLGLAQELQKQLEKLNQETEKKRKENIDILFDDPFLKAICQCVSIDNLENDAREKLKNDFNVLKENINFEKFESEMNKPGKVFPGLGDVKRKPDNPFGDYFIFHELMTFSRQKKKDVIFLTNDTTKGDWMKSSKEPHIHYLENFYLNTGQILYIFDADRSLDKTLNLKLEALINTSNLSDINLNDKISADSLRSYLNTKYPNLPYPKEIDLNRIVNELSLNGYMTIQEIENDIDRANRAYEEYCKNLNYNTTHFNSVGQLRIRLEILNEKYRMILKDGTEQVFDDMHNNYKHLIT